MRDMIRAAGLFALCSAAAAAESVSTSHFLALTSDGDSHPFNWFGTTLGEPWQSRAPGTDALTVIPVGANGELQSAVSIPVGNSWAGPSRAVAATPDGRVMFVVESQLSRAESGSPKGPGDLKPGNAIRAVDASDLRRPRVIAELKVFAGVSAVSVSRDGKTLSFTGGTSDKGPLGFVSWDGRSFGTPRYFALRGLESYHSIRGAVPAVTGATWNPKHDVLAVAVGNINLVMFYAVRRDMAGEVVDIEPHGEPVGTNKGMFAGSWTPDGRYLLVNETLWPDNLSEIENWSPTLIEVLRPADPAKPMSATNHNRVVAGVGITRSCEGLAISPDGTKVAAVSLGQSWFPHGHAFRTPATVTLLNLDLDTGVLMEVAKATFEGVMPEDLAFTPDGHRLAVAVYNYQDGRSRGGVELFNIVTGSTPRLVHHASVDVPYGVNTILAH